MRRSVTTGPAPVPVPVRARSRRRCRCARPWCPPGVGRPGAGPRVGARPPGRRRADGPAASSSVSSVIGVLPSLDCSCPAVPSPFRGLVPRSSARSFSRARCRRMLAAFGLISRTSAISAGVSCSHAHRRSSSASSGRSLAIASSSAGVRRPRRRAAGAGRRRPGGRVDHGDPGREPGLPPLAAPRVGQAAPRHAVRPGQRLGGYVVQPAPADQQGVGEHVVGGRRIGPPGQEPPQRLHQPGCDLLEMGAPVVVHGLTVSHAGHGVTRPASRVAGGVR